MLQWLSISALGFLFTHYPSPEADSTGAIGAAPMPFTCLYLGVFLPQAGQDWPLSLFLVSQAVMFSAESLQAAQKMQSNTDVYFGQRRLHILAPFLSLQSSSMAQKRMGRRTSLYSAFISLLLSCCRDTREPWLLQTAQLTEAAKLLYAPAPGKKLPGI